MNTMTRRVLPVLVVATVSVTLAACSSSPKSSPGNGTTAPATSVGSSAASHHSSGSASKVSPGGTVDVCSLLTAAQASSQNEVTYGATTPRHVMDGWDECSYQNTAHQDGADIYPLQVAVLSVADCFTQLKSTLGGGSGTSVSGVGDQALGYSIGLLVQSGSNCIEVQGMTHAELSGDYSHDIAMAKIVISALH